MQPVGMPAMWPRPIHASVGVVTFSAPSTAAAVVLGRGANGRTEWKGADGRTLKEIQEAEAAQ